MGELVLMIVSGLVFRSSSRLLLWFMDKVADKSKWRHLAIAWGLSIAKLISFLAIWYWLGCFVFDFFS